MKEMHKSFNRLLANLYSLHLKTLNYHWHVSGPHFKPLHLFFEDQYQELFEFIDLIAERIVTIGFNAPATLAELANQRTLKDGTYNLTSAEMIADLLADYTVLIDDIYDSIETCKNNEDEGGITLLTDILVKVEKTVWMLRATGGGF